MYAEMKHSDALYTEKFVVLDVCPQFGGVLNCQSIVYRSAGIRQGVASNKEPTT